MSNHLYQKKTIERVTKKLKILNSKYSTIFILNTRLFISLITLLLVVIFFDIGIVLGPLIAIIIYYLFEYLFLDLKIIKRIKKLNQESLIFFELLLISIKKDNLLQAINNVANIVNIEISFHFKKVLNEVSIGKSLSSSLDTLKSHIPSKEIKFLIASLQNTNMTILEKELEEQIKVLREKNALYNEYKARLIPIKGTMLTILFVIVFVLIVIYQLSILNMFQ